MSKGRNNSECPFFFSAWGFISTAVLSLLTGKARRCSPVVYACSVLFILYYAFGRTG